MNVLYTIIPSGLDSGDRGRPTELFFTFPIFVYVRLSVAMKSRGEDAEAIQVMTRLHRIGGQKKELTLRESRMP